MSGSAFDEQEKEWAPLFLGLLYGVLILGGSIAMILGGYDTSVTGILLWVIRVFFMFGFPIALIIWIIRRVRKETRESMSQLMLGFGAIWLLGSAIFWVMLVTS